MAIAGVYARDGRELAKFDVARSLEAMALGRSRPAVWKRQKAVLGTCESAVFAVNRHFPDSIAVFEGRLDNRQELAAAIDGSDSTLQSLCAAEIVLFAYEKWGEDFADHMVGDFSCAVWDDPSQRLLLARDAMGALPLYFWQGPHAIAFATEPRGLMVHPNIPKASDEIWLARFLALLPQEGTRSHYKDIQRVPPGHVVIFNASGIAIHRYWRPEALAPIRFAKDADYCEALRAIFEKAVRCRIDTSASIGTFLSGGLDSSSVTAFAARLLADRGRALTSFTAIPTHDFEIDEKSRRFGDERELAALTAAKYPNVEHVLVPNVSGDLFATMDNVNLTSDMPLLNPYNELWLNGIGKAARQRGITVLLSGQMGNATISYDGKSLLRSLLRDRQWIRLFKAACLRRRAGASWINLAYRLCEGLLSPALRHRLLEMRGLSPNGLQDFSALNMNFARETGVTEEAASMAGNLTNLQTRGDDVRLAMIQSMDPALYWRGYKRRHGIDVLDPTADRRVVEYCLAIPQEQFFIDGVERSLLKSAFRGILPEPVLATKRIGLQAADWHVAAQAAQSEMVAEIGRLEDSPLASRALDLPGMRKLAETFPNCGWQMQKVVFAYRLKLARGVAAGRFVRRVEGGNS